MTFQWKSPRLGTVKAVFTGYGSGSSASVAKYTALWCPSVHLSDTLRRGDLACTVVILLYNRTRAMAGTTCSILLLLHGELSF